MASTTTQHESLLQRSRPIVVDIMHMAVLVLSVLLIVFISYDTFKRSDFITNSLYMRFQLWVCIVFIADYFIEMIYAPDKWRYSKRRFLFLFISIPYISIINWLHIELSADALFFVRFIPLMRGATALAIVFGALTKNAVASFFNSYIVMLVMIVYFSSLIFFQCEHGVNPQVTTYWIALWWSAMNMSTVGCYINAMTVTGRIIAVILPIAGMIIFPLFTVYLTDYVRRHSRPTKSTPKS